MKKLFSFVLLTVGAGVLASAAITPASAQSVFAYPKAGQSAQQQQLDQSECRQWAMGQTGYNPNQPQQMAGGSYYSPPPPPPESSSGVLGLGSGGMFKGRGMLGDAATGAALGAAGGAIAGDAGKGAAIGTLAGAFLGGIKRRSRQQERAQWERQRQQQMAYQQQQAAQAQQQGSQNFNRAFAACMTARNYQVQ